VGVQQFIDFVKPFCAVHGISPGMPMDYDLDE
jgi:hypothetical protein